MLALPRLVLVFLTAALFAADVTLLNVSYDPTREFYEEINAAFSKAWKAKTGDNVTVNYYGAVWGQDQPFDESYSRGTPASFGLTPGGLIEGWVKGLEGVTVGSRVMLVIPPDLGYGPQGSGEKIPGNSTLVFVIDVLGV